MERFWVFLDGRVQGPVDVPALRKLSGFNLLTQVCSETSQTWRMADEVIEIKSYFLAPPRISSMPAEAMPVSTSAELASGGGSYPPVMTSAEPAIPTNVSLRTTPDTSS